MITKKMHEHAKRLIARTNAAINAYLEAPDRTAEPMNVADLSCRHVRFCIDDTGDWWPEVVIDEAGDCPKLCSFVMNTLRAEGFFPVTCATEW